jgi:hypothetical protein
VNDRHIGIAMFVVAKHETGNPPVSITVPCRTISNYQLSSLIAFSPSWNSGTKVSRDSLNKIARGFIAIDGCWNTLYQYWLFVGERTVALFNEYNGSRVPL